MKKVVIIFRFIGFIVFGLIGFYLWDRFIYLINPSLDQLPYKISAAVVLAVLGFLVMPYLTLFPVQRIRSYLVKVSGQTLLLGLVGLVVGLIIAALVSFPISYLPSPFSDILPFAAVLLFSYLGVAIAVSRSRDFGEVFSFMRKPKHASGDTASRFSRDHSILVDTSVIIDGRIADIAKTGFIPGNLVLPRFVLNELQYVADAPESLRRQRGRRGMDVVSQLQKDRTISLTVADLDVEGVRDVDEKLVVLGRQMHASILTNDFNLNRIAELQGVHVLNINELANAVKSILIPGETLPVKVIQEGKESGQGVGYLDDGTMVVVEEGRKLVDKEIVVTVTKVLQTAAGRMIFAKPGGELEDK